jgi:hypothetical protein
MESTCVSYVNILFQVLLLLGGTVVSPKEAYVICMPPLCPEADNLRLTSCVKSMYRQLIGHDVMASEQVLPPTNLVLLLRAPRQCGLTWFRAKQMFKLSSRGRQFHLNLVSVAPLPRDSVVVDTNVNHHDTTHEEAEDIDISGIERIQGSPSGLELDDVSMTKQCESNMSIVNDDSLPHENVEKPQQHDEIRAKYFNSFLPERPVSRDICHTTMDVCTVGEEDYMWFQAPVVVKGYRGKTSQPCNGAL